MKDKINGLVKKERTKILINIYKELEENYMKKYLGKELTFIPEVYENGYLTGHTGNYLLIKAKCDEKLVGKEVKIIMKKIQYPYIISEISVK